MATKTRTEMIDLALKRLGVLGAGQTASADDADLVGSLLDSVHDQLMKRGLVNFVTSAFPSWSQAPFGKVLEAESAPYYGKLEQPGAARLLRNEGESELAEQMQAKRHPNPIEFKAY